MLKILSIVTAASLAMLSAAAAADLPRREPPPPVAPVGKAPIGKYPGRQGPARQVSYSGAGRNQGLTYQVTEGVLAFAALEQSYREHPLGTPWNALNTSVVLRWIGFRGASDAKTSDENAQPCHSCWAFMRSRSPQGCKFSRRARKTAAPRQTAAKPQTASKAVYYVDFRARTAASYGHAFVWYGRSDQKQIEVAGLHPASDSVVPYILGHVIPVLAETGKELRRPRRAVPDRELPRLHDRGAGAGSVCLYQAPAGDLAGVERAPRGTAWPSFRPSRATWACAFRDNHLLAWAAIAGLRQVLGPDTAIDITVIDEIHTRVKIKQLLALFRRHDGFGLVGIVGVHESVSARARHRPPVPRRLACR